MSKKMVLSLNFKVGNNKSIIFVQIITNRLGKHNENNLSFQFKFPSIWQDTFISTCIFKEGGGGSFLHYVEKRMTKINI